MYYVYFIRSQNFTEQTYIGYTNNLKRRLNEHNFGYSAFTEKFKPWELIFFAAFNNENQALNFEKYLKSGSGREFLKKRLI